MAKMELSAQEKKTLKSMFWNSGLVFCGFNMVKMEGNAFTCTMAPAIEELYSDPEERKQALVRQNNFFNTHAVLFSFIAGLAYALEREKVALMGPTAGIGDAFFFNCVRVIAAGIGIGLCAEGNLLGVLIFVLLYGGSQVVARWYLLKIGYTMGTSFIDSIFSSGLMTSLTKSAAILGLSMVGAMVASMVNVKLAWTIQVGQTSVVVLDVVNSIMPGILSVALVFGLVALIKKGVRPVTLVLGILVLSVALAFFGIF